MSLLVLRAGPGLDLLGGWLGAHGVYVQPED